MGIRERVAKLENEQHGIDPCPLPSLVRFADTLEAEQKAERELEAANKDKRTFSSLVVVKGYDASKPRSKK